MNELALFAGAGGGILGGKLLGWRTVCAVERDAYAAQVLSARQNDGALEPFPIWSDVCSFDGRPWRGLVDIVSGGFPCQDISAAGKGAGIDGQRSGLWSEFARIIGEVRPRFVFVENSPMLVGRGLGRVLGDLASLGFDAEWCVLGADNAGAPHIRKRIWILAYATRGGWISSQRKSDTYNTPEAGSRASEPIGGGFGVNPYVADSESIGSRSFGPGEVEPPRPNRISRGSESVPDACCSRLEEREGPAGEWAYAPVAGSGWWATEPRLGRVADGVAHRVDRLKAIGNGQVPAVAALAFRTLYNRLIG